MEDSMTVSADGYNLQVFRDEYAENPREWDNLGKMVCWQITSAFLYSSLS